MICEICGETFYGSWTDFHGQMTCMTCGAPYQMKDYSGAPPDAKYPYLDLADEFKPIFKEYWDTTKKRCRLGLWLGKPRDVVEEQIPFKDWLEEKHPEWLSGKK